MSIVTPPKALIFNHSFAYEAERLIRSFFPPFKAELFNNAPYSGNDYILSEMSDIFTVRIKIREYDKTYSEQPAMPFDFGSDTQVPALNNAEAQICRLLYRALSDYTGEMPKWGILTGIRPVRLIEKFGTLPEVISDRYFTERILVDEKKLSLARRIIGVQSPIVKAIPEKSFALYVSIPFCPSRCSYCSFVSHSVEKAKNLIPTYLESLSAELFALGKTAKALGMCADSVYIGGGTPTVLEAAQLSALLKNIEAAFDLSAVREYTVEAGRPDTITREKLEAIKAAGVERISVNPQTLNNSVLEAIGRHHTAEDFFEAYSLARTVGFDSINTDLIAGLPTDTLGGFTSTLDKIAALSPENITVHSLSLKRSSALYHLSEREIKGEVGCMTEYALDKLSTLGYNPYYLYRQKNTVENNENIGYSKKGHESLYNIAIMEELETILAAGCGASTKLVTPHGITRLCNVKYPYEYGVSEKALAEKCEKITELLGG